MGLSSFNAMRARHLAEQNALKKADDVPKIEPVEAVEVNSSVLTTTENVVADKPKRKTDAEKLRKKAE